MNRRRLRAFIALAEDLHFGRAAVRCNITQSALSQQIRQLEEELNVDLALRTKRSVSLTQAGQAFLIEARKILRNMDDAVNLVREVGSGRSGQLIVAATAPALFISLPEIIYQYKKVMPGIQVMVRELTTTDQESALRSGDIDVGICHPPLEDSSLQCSKVAEIFFDIVMNKDNVLAKKRSLCLKDLINERFIVFSRVIAPNMYDHVIALCQEEGFSPKVILEASPAQSIVGLAACGVGIGLIASQLQHFPQPLVVFKKLTGPAPKLSLGVAYSTAVPSVTLQKFVEVAQRVGKNLV
jgi:DNA-binding transcriptional LysR family regulator